MSKFTKVLGIAALALVINVGAAQAQRGGHGGSGRGGGGFHGGGFHGGGFHGGGWGALVKIGIAVAGANGSDESLLALMEGFHARSDTRLYRREMFFAMRAALRMTCAQPANDLGEAIWEVQNRLRHAGAKSPIGVLAALYL